ncbi:metal-sulfur cluster biosynthetic enzyme [Pedobacter sp. UYP30]
MDIITNNKNNCNLAIQDLHDVFGPEIGLNVVDLGHIYEINFDEEKKKV